MEREEAVQGVEEDDIDIGTGLPATSGMAVVEEKGDMLPNIHISLDKKKSKGRRASTKMTIIKKEPKPAAGGSSQESSGAEMVQSDRELGAIGETDETGIDASKGGRDSLGMGNINRERGIVGQSVGGDQATERSVDPGALDSRSGAAAETGTPAKDGNEKGKVLGDPRTALGPSRESDKSKEPALALGVIGVTTEGEKDGAGTATAGKSQPSKGSGKGGEEASARALARGAAGTAPRDGPGKLASTKSEASGSKTDGDIKKDVEVRHARDLGNIGKVADGKSAGLGSESKKAQSQQGETSKGAQQSLENRAKEAHVGRNVPVAAAQAVPTITGTGKLKDQGTTRDTKGKLVGSEEGEGKIKIEGTVDRGAGSADKTKQEPGVGFTVQGASAALAEGYEPSKDTTEGSMTSSVPSGGPQTSAAAAATSAAGDVEDKQEAKEKIDKPKEKQSGRFGRTISGLGRIFRGKTGEAKGTGDQNAPGKGTDRSADAAVESFLEVDNMAPVAAEGTLSASEGLADGTGSSRGEAGNESSAAILAEGAEGSGTGKSAVGKGTGEGQESADELGDSGRRKTAGLFSFGSLFRSKSKVGAEESKPATMSDRAVDIDSGMPQGQGSHHSDATEGAVAPRGGIVREDLVGVDVTDSTQRPEVEIKNLVDGSVITNAGVHATAGELSSGPDAKSQKLSTRSGLGTMMQQAGAGLAFGVLGVLFFFFGKPEDEDAKQMLDDDLVSNTCWTKHKNTEWMQSWLWHSE